MFEYLSSFSNTLSSAPVIFISLSSTLGLLIGSFLSVVIYRMPKIMKQEWHKNCLELQGKEPLTQAKISLSKPRSACPNCNHQITALENIPVISYLLLGGKCKSCKTRISLRYPFVELLTSALLGIIAYQFGYTYTTIFTWLFTLALITLTFIDFDTQLLPDDITLPLLWLGLLFNLNDGFTDLSSAVIGTVSGYLALWSIYWVFKLISGKEGMGYGDFKLLAAIGAWLGWQLLPVVILFSSVLGSVTGIALILLKGKSGNTAIPFGPFLALGGIAALFFGQQLVSLYL